MQYLVDHLVDLLFIVVVEAKPGVIVEVLPDSEFFHQQVILGYKADNAV